MMCVYTHVHSPYMFFRARKYVLFKTNWAYQNWAPQSGYIPRLPPWLQLWMFRKPKFWSTPAWLGRVKSHQLRIRNLLLRLCVRACEYACVWRRNFCVRSVCTKVFVYVRDARVWDRMPSRHYQKLAGCVMVCISECVTQWHWDSKCAPPMTVLLSVIRGHAGALRADWSLSPFTLSTVLGRVFNLSTLMRSHAMTKISGESLVTTWTQVTTMRSMRSMRLWIKTKIQNSVGAPW